MDFKEKVEEKSLDAKSVFIASLLAGLNEFGMLNQAVMKIASRRSGKYLAMCAQEKGNIEIDKNKSLKEKVEYLLTLLNEVLFISTDVKVEEAGGDSVIVKIKTSKCRFCPKGVGGAELEGTICPFPGLIEEFLNQFLDQKVKVSTENNRILWKEGDWCNTKYKIAVVK